MSQMCCVDMSEPKYSWCWPKIHLQNVSISNNRKYYVALCRLMTIHFLITQWVLKEFHQPSGYFPNPLWTLYIDLQFRQSVKVIIFSTDNSNMFTCLQNVILGTVKMDFFDIF